MSAGPQKAAAIPAPLKRRAWFALYPRNPTLEEACRRAHAFASRFPALYRLRVTLLCMRAALAPWFALACLVAVTAAFPWALRESEVLGPLYAEPVLRWALDGFVLASMIPLTLSYFAGLVRGLTLRLPEPGGVELEKAQAPRLFRMLAEMSRTLKAPVVEEVYVSPDRVLEVRHEPCGGMGILGRARTILTLGLPLAEELSPQQFRALVAHELALLATHNRRFGGRVLGLRRRLAALRQAAEASALARTFWSRLPDEILLETLDSTIRRLTAATFPAVRQHEAEADAIAATIAGRDYAASALLRERLAGHAVSQQFQQECIRRAETAPDVPAELFAWRANAASGAFNDTQINAWLRAELEVKDNLAESQPPLWDRLRLLGFRLDNMVNFRDLLEQVQPHCELGETSARYFLGDAAEPVRAGFFSDWVAHQAADWRKRFDVYESLRATAAEFEDGGAALESDPAALWQMAVAVGNTRGWKTALPLAQRILEIAPEHADANMLAGQFLLEEGNSGGIAALERAMKSDSRVIPVACTLAARFLEAREERDAASAYQRRMEEHRKQAEAVARDRNEVRATDNFSAADCPAATAEAVIRALERHKSHIRAAYLMRKLVPEGDNTPVYVLGVERRSFPFENAGLANRLLLERIMRVPGMPANVLLCVVTRANRELVARWKGVPCSLVFPAPAPGWPNAPVAQAQTAIPASLLRHHSPEALPASSSPAASK